MNRFRLLAPAAAVAACVPCVLLPLVAAAVASGGLAVLESGLGMALAVPLAAFATGVVLFAIALGRRRSCEVTR